MTSRIFIPNVYLEDVRDRFTAIMSKFYLYNFKSLYCVFDSRCNKLEKDISDLRILVANQNRRLELQDKTMQDFMFRGIKPPATVLPSDLGSRSLFPTVAASNASSTATTSTTTTAQFNSNSNSSSSIISTGALLGKRSRTEEMIVLIPEPAAILQPL